jgi:hypothetical protein
MTTERFCTICEIAEVPEGLRITEYTGETSLLRRDNERYGRIEEVLRNAHETSVRWPVRIARSSDGVIMNAWVAWAGRPIHVVDLESETACRVCFLLQSEHKFIKHDHPDFQRLLETLMDATVEKRSVYYFMQPGETNILLDVCFADPVAETADSH